LADGTIFKYSTEGEDFGGAFDTRAGVETFLGKLSVEATKTLIDALLVMPGTNP